MEGEKLEMTEQLGGNAEAFVFDFTIGGAEGSLRTIVCFLILSKHDFLLVVVYVLGGAGMERKDLLAGYCRLERMVA